MPIAAGPSSHSKPDSRATVETAQPCFLPVGDYPKHFAEPLGFLLYLTMPVPLQPAPSANGSLRRG